MNSTLETRNSKPVQLSLDSLIRQLPDRARMLKLSWIKTTFGLSVDGARELVDTGRLRFAFDMSDHNARRAEIRVWKGSVQAYAEHGDGVLSLTTDHCQLTTVIHECLPPGDGPFTLTLLMRLWDVEGTHLHDLCKAGELRLVPGQVLKSKQSPLIERASAAEFLRRRKIG